MARILLCWELGDGLAHLSHLHKAADYFIQQGHEIWVAARDLGDVKALFSDSVRVVQSPYIDKRISYLTKSDSPPRGFAELLYRSGYYSADALTGILEAWKMLLETIRPDMLIIDHSPTALLATRGQPIPRILVGTGFSLPDHNRPTSLFYNTESAKRETQEHEKEVLRVINQVCYEQNIPTVRSLADLYEDSDSNILSTWSELDPYGFRNPAQRRKTVYVGTIPETYTEPADFPHFRGPKIYCHVNWGADVPVLLKALQSIECSAVIVATDFPQRAIDAHPGRHLNYVMNPVNMDEVFEKTTFAILNAGMNLTSQFLKAGIPVAMIPQHVEQLLIARRVEALNAGYMLNLKDNETAINGFQKVNSRRTKEYAALFSQKYDDFRPDLELMKELVSVEKRYLM